LIREHDGDDMQDPILEGRIIIIVIIIIIIII